MSGKHTDDYYEAIKSMSYDVEKSEIAAWLRNQSYLQINTGQNFDWEYTKSHKKEDAVREFEDAYNRRGAWQKFAPEADTETEYLEQLFNLSKDEDDKILSLFEPSDEKGKRSILVAAAFPGDKYIIEYENDYIYVPESRYCGVRALAKSVNVKVRDFMKMKNANATGMSIADVYDLFKAYCIRENISLKDEDLPNYYTWRDSEEKFRVVHSKNGEGKKIVSNNKGALLLIRMYENRYHTIYVKNEATINYMVDSEYIYNHLKIKLKKELDGDQNEEKQMDTEQFWSEMRDYMPPINVKRDAIVYDIETYISFKKLASEATKASRQLIPYAIGWMYVEYLPKLKVDENGVIIDKPADKKYICNKTKEEIMEDVHILFPHRDKADVVEMFWDDVSQYCVNKFPDRKWETSDAITVFAHNGGTFDHHFIKEAKNVQLLSTIRSGSKIKQMTIRHKATGVQFKFLDSLLFTTMSLKKSCEGLGVPPEYWKQDFNIVDKTRAWYLANNKKAPYEIRKTFVPRHDSVMAEDMAEIGMKADIVTEVDEVIKKENDWYEYLAYDIISLAFVVFNYSSSMLNVFGLEMNTCTGAAGLAWQLMMKNLTALMNCYLPNSDVNNTFIRASIKGGRVMHLMKTFKALNDRKLISFDINSLYPAAMERFAYPTGIPSAFNFDPSVRDNGNLIHDWIQKGYMFIAEFAYVTGNQRNPLHAYKTGSTSEIFDGVATSPNSLIYPQCSDEENPLIDVSTSVDIIEMLKDGYKVLWVRRALVWKHSMKIFSPLIGHLYDTRTKLKKAKNPLEGLYKILMNSSYGKFLEQIKESTFFTTEKEWTEQKNFIIHRKSGKYRQIAKLPNGQIEYASKAMFAKSGKPAYIGSFILAYSKVIANEYIRKIGIENIWYSDTDSFYTDKVDACEQSSVLGGIKNDYGDNCFIDTAMFVDYKRYYLEVVNGSKREIKAKFNGLAIPKHEHMGDQVMMITNVMEEVISLPEQRSVRNYKDMKTFFEFFVENPGQLNDMRVIQEKWVRGKECRIDSKIFKYQVDPQRRAKWVKKDDEWIWYPLGYDLEKPEYKATEPVFYEHAKETEETLVNKRFKCRQKLPFILKDGDHFSGKVSLEKLKNRLMEEKGVEVYDSIFDDVEAFFSTSDGLIVKRKNQQYYKVDCYGVSEQIREQVIIHELVFALEQQFAKIDNLKICSPEVDVKSVEKTLSELYHALKINAGVDDTLTIKPEFNLDKSSLNSKLNNLRQSKKKPIN